MLGEEYRDVAEQLRTVLDEYNGTPVGLFTGDECLSGLSPVQGTELCAVVEQMYSYEWLYACTGDVKWAERLEVLAFNALPATISDDMWAHQYVQQSNQISCEKFPGKSFFRTNGPMAHLFGLEPNYGCCTANFNQAWPKLALSTFLYGNGEILSALPIPSQLKTEDAEISLESNYPFENELHYHIKAKKDLVLKVRIPSFAKDLQVNGKAEEGGVLSFAIKAGEETIHISFDTEVEWVERPHGLRSVKKGSLIFALPIQYEKRKLEYVKDNVERKFPYCDYEYVGRSPWNYGFADGEFELIRHTLSEIPFSSEEPPLLLKCKLRPVEWELADGYETVCAKTPVSNKAIGEAEEKLLIPYGCAKLRMTEMPMTE